MPNKKISQLDSIDQLLDNEKVLINQGGTNKTATVPVIGTKLNADVASGVPSYASRIASNLTAARNSNAASDLLTTQDLTGIYQNLHVSPNAITAMFVYDTSKDSDGGAWTEKCSSTSWYNETLSGKWLGAQSSEFEARNIDATLGTELIANSGPFTNTTGWTPFSGNTSLSVVASNLRLTIVGGSAADGYFSFSTIAGTTYKVNVSFIYGSGITYAKALIGTSGGSGGLYVTSTTTSSNTWSFVFVATGTTTYLTLEIGGSVGATADWSLASVKTVTAINTASGDYFQLTTNGKFYRLWKNLLQRSNEFTNSAWAKNGVSVTASSLSSPDGSLNASKLIPGASNQQFIYQNIGAGQYTHSVYAKAGEYNLLSMGVYDSAWRMQAVFNLTTGTISSNGAGSAAIVSVGNGWYRCSVSGTTFASAPFRIQVTNNAADGTSTFAGNGSDGLHIWGAQVEYGSTATTYEAKTADGSISETFRGNKRSFPKLSAIVAEGSNVTIYDLTEPGRPMWMRFVTGGSGSNYNFLLGGSVSNLAALNGLLLINSGSNGLVWVDVPKDSGRQIYSGGVFDFSPNRIASRNSLPLRTQGATQPTIANNIVNAVAMTVLPDAPVDPVTGLKVPTIVVATGGGVSVIKHNGATVNPYGGTTDFIEFTQDYRLRIKRSGLSAVYISNDWRYATTPSAPLILNGTSNLPNISNTNFTKGARSKSQSFMGLNGNGEIAAIYENPGNYNKSSIFRITNNYNTGHMIGDIRRNYLSDIDVSNVSWSELLVDYSFNDPTQWVANASVGASVSNGAFRFDGVTSAGNPLEAVRPVLSPTFTIGKKYTITMVVSAGSISGFDLNIAGVASPVTYAIPGTYTYTFTATATTGFQIRTRLGSSTRNQVVDSISIKEAVADRSYKDQSSTINGTLTKSPVATNAQLVGYSGFSTSNYLREPYSADLDFGTGEWCASVWINIPATLPTTSFPTISSELVLNGGFDTMDNWTLGSGVSISDGSLIFNATTTSNGATQTGIITSNNTYYIVTVIVNSINGPISILRNNGNFVGTFSAAGTYSFMFNSGTTNGYSDIKLWWGNSGTVTASIDNISVKKIDTSLFLDRSYSTGPKINIGVTGTGNIVATVYDGTTTRTVTTLSNYNTGVWSKVETNYTIDGNLSIRINGIQVASTTGTALTTLNNSNAVLTIGNGYSLNSPSPGSIALLKLSATVPTIEQSQWMYEQEKMMFQPGAQVCLPSSGAVNDLSYDPKTDTWFAAQSTHVSEWKGLVRTAYRKPATSTYSKIASDAGVKLLARASGTVEVEIPPIQIKKEFYSAPVDSTINTQNISIFEFDSIASQTDFTLPVGYTAQAVYSAGVQKVEGTSKDYTRLFDGFKETIRFGTAPATGTWIKIKAVRNA